MEAAALEVEKIFGADAPAPVGTSARRGEGRTRGAGPKIPLREVWLDCDVAEYLHVCVRTVKRLAVSPRPGELDLRKANPVMVGYRRWYADNVRKVVENAMVAKA